MRCLDFLIPLSLLLLSNSASAERLNWQDIDFKSPLTAEQMNTLKEHRADIRAAAEKGDADAQIRLAGIYSHGLGVPKDYVEAAKWLRMAAEQGNPMAQYFLASLYGTGQGVPKDNAEKIKWCRKAAKQGYQMAETRLACLITWG